MRDRFAVFHAAPAEKREQAESPERRRAREGAGSPRLAG
jgi:hypothetical protein